MLTTLEDLMLKATTRLSLYDIQLEFQAPCITLNSFYFCLLAQDPSTGTSQRAEASKLGKTASSGAVRGGGNAEPYVLVLNATSQSRGNRQNSADKSATIKALSDKTALVDVQ